MKQPKRFYLNPLSPYYGDKGPAISVERDSTATFYISPGKRVTGLRLCDVGWIYQCVRSCLREIDGASITDWPSIKVYHPKLRYQEKFGKGWSTPRPACLVATAVNAERTRLDWCKKQHFENYFYFPTQVDIDRTDADNRHFLTPCGSYSGQMGISISLGGKRNTSGNWLTVGVESARIVEHNLLRALDYMATDDLDEDE